MSFRRTFPNYVGIGVITVVADVGIYRALLIVAPLIVAISVAYLCAASIQFSLNKYLNFRDFSRSTAAQARSYIAISVIMWIFTLACIEALVHVANVSPFTAKIASLPLSAATGYLVTRYVVFGKGLRALLRYR